VAKPLRVVRRTYHPGRTLRIVKAPRSPARIDDGAREGVAGFFVENDAFDDGGARGDGEGQR
jgi:hypothetical protein